MRRYISLLLALVMILSAVPVMGISAAEVETKDTALLDFEDAVLDVPLSELPGYKSHKAAAIAAAPGKTDDQALRLYDAQQTQIPEYMHTFESATGIVLEFDFYATDAESIAVRLLNGNATYATTAFWLHLRSTGVWAYDGSYVQISTQPFAVNAWNSVRIAVTTGAGAEAVVYINGVYAGTAAKPTKTIGSNAATIDSIYFQATKKTQDIYLDDLKVTPVSYSESFEQLELDALATGMSGYKADFGAVVKADPADSSRKALQLCDSANATWPYLHYIFTPSDCFAVEFDLYTQQDNYFGIQLLSGVRSNKNTAFWLQFRANGIYSYDKNASGSAGYVSVSDKAYVLNAWNHVRLEVTTGTGGKVDIYLNGEFAGTAQKPDTSVIGSSALTVNGMYISAAQHKNNAFYLDDLKMYLPGMAQSFDGLEKSAPVEAVAGHAANYAASIVEDPVTQGQKALRLCDATNSALPFFHYQVEAADTVMLEFDLYTREENIFTVQLLSGSRSDKNTAYWLQLRSNGVSSYDLKADGTKGYIPVSDKGLQLGQWNKICIRATTGANAEAVVYLNGEYAGTVEKPSTSVIGSTATTVNGAYIAVGQHKNRAVYLDNLKMTTPVQVENGVMRLLADDVLDTLTVDAGMTLDLNGHTLLVNDLLCFGSVVDTASRSGKLQAKNMILSDLKYLPLYDSNAGGYRFFAYELKNLGERTNNDGSVTYGFAVNFANTQAYELLAAGDCHVEVDMTLAWGKQEKTFAFSTELLQQYAALRLRHSNVPAAMMLTLTGLDTLAPGTKLSVTPIVKAGGTAVAGVPMGEIEQPDSTIPGELLEIEMGPLFDIADNTEKEGLPANNAIVKEDFSLSGGVYGFSQFPNAVYDPATDRVYINYTRHRDMPVDYPYDSTRVYNVDTLLSAQADAQLQDDYVQMKTENTMFFTAMTRLRDGRIFAQNYIAYYQNQTTATTYSWIVDKSGNWTKVQGTLTLPQNLTSSGAQAGTNWYRYGFSRCLIELDDGTLLGSMYGTYGTVLVQSKDLGKTWTYRSTIAKSALGLEQPYVNTDGTNITWFEPAVTRCADGSLLCVMRTWRDKPLYQVRSYDDGLNWTEPMLLPGLNPENKEGMSIYPQLVLLSNGVLALATGVPGDTVYFSLDGCGYNWDHGITTYSGDTTGNAAIAELGYDPATDTVTLLAMGDKGFNNESLSGVWGRIVTVTRNHVQKPQLASAKAYAGKTVVGKGDTLNAWVDAVFNTDGALINKPYTVRWYSLTPEIATVDQSGKITAKDLGTAKIQALVTCGAETVKSNEVSVEICDRGVLDNISVTTSKWVLKIGETGTLTKTAYNKFGQQFVSSLAKQEYFDGDHSKPKYYESNAAWQFASRDTNVLTVDANTGAYEAKGAGVTQILATATSGGVTLTKEITVIVESTKWQVQSFESTTFPTNCKYTSLVTLSTANCYSGSRSVYIKDNSTTLAPMLRFEIPESKGVIVEFMLYVESNAHSPTFGVGYPQTDGKYSYANNSVHVGLLYNAITGAQGYQAFDGIAWSINNRANKIPIKQWNKIRLEVTTDKPGKLYVNDTLVGEMPLAADNELLNTIYFCSGGTGYTGDAFYVDDIRYMVFS